jgi:predicted regulator of Ras-like GTPase activity (Roadblock/LC7/MglB family)
MFKDILEGLLKRVDGSMAAFLAGSDGLIIEQCCREGHDGLDLEQLAADCTQIIRNGSGMLDDLAEVALSGTNQRLILRLLAGSYFVVLIISGSAMTGRARYELLKLQSSLEAEIAG